jgi:hypothetical protein
MIQYLGPYSVRGPKLNFETTAKGNPGVAVVGRVIRESGGTIICLYVGSIGN